jgi:hypothetical protein
VINGLKTTKLKTTRSKTTWLKAAGLKTAKIFADGSKYNAAVTPAVADPLA